MLLENKWPFKAFLLGLSDKLSDKFDIKGIDTVSREAPLPNLFYFPSDKGLLLTLSLPQSIIIGFCKEHRSR